MLLVEAERRDEEAEQRFWQSKYNNFIRQSAKMDINMRILIIGE